MVFLGRSNAIISDVIGVVRVAHGSNLFFFPISLSSFVRSFGIFVVAGFLFECSRLGFCVGCCWEATLNDLQGVPGREGLRALILHSWRLCAVLMQIVWRRVRPITNNFGFFELLEEWSWSELKDRFPGGALTDEEVDFFVFVHGQQIPRTASYLVDRVSVLPDFGSDRPLGTRTELAGIIGFSVGSETCKRLYNHLWRLHDLRVRHRGEVLDLCFECDRVTL